MRVSAYRPDDARTWDELCARAPMATFLHSRRFLSYHGDRFFDRSAVIYAKGETMVGLFPAAENPANPREVISHPGISFGGLIHEGRLAGANALDAFIALQRHYRELGYSSLRYKAVPHIYHALPSCDDLYALFRLGALRYRCDLSCAIDLDNESRPSSRRMRGRRKALANGLEVSASSEMAEPFWHVLVAALQRKHGVRPVHSLQEILRLRSMFPESVEFVTALKGGDVVAGTVLFHSARVSHAQYIAASVSGEACGALDLVFHESIASARAAGKRYFDFGISTENEGQVLNEGLYTFKSEFGGGGIVHEFFCLPLDRG